MSVMLPNVMAIHPIVAVNAMAALKEKSGCKLWSDRLTVP